jgi:hypothetical protein
MACRFLQRCWQGGNVTKAESYRKTLRALQDWDSFLLQESGLPGRRANLELAQAVADEGSASYFQHLLTFDPETAPTNTPHEFLAFCGVVGLGRLLAQGQAEVMTTLRRHASDARWRIREAVAMALQRLGAMAGWSTGNLLEKRAAAAALCEPALLSHEPHARRVLRLLDKITASVTEMEDRKSPEFKTLRKGLGYCWSVAVAAFPEEGKPLMEKWLASTDRDVLWIMRQNLKKKRLLRMDAAWVEHET